MPKLPRSIPTTAALAIILAVSAARSALADWPAGGMLIDSVRADGVIPSSYIAMPDGTGGALLLNGRAGRFYRARRVSADGVTRSGWPIAMPLGMSAPDGADGFLHFFFSPSDLTADLYAQHYDGTGGVAPGWPPGGILVCGAAGLQWPPFVCADGAGGAFVAWRDTRADSRGQLYAQHVSAAGATDPSAPCGVLVAGLDGELHPWTLAAVADGAGGFYLAWQAWGSGGSSGYGDLHLQRLSGALAPLWAGGGFSVSTGRYGAYPKLAADGTGGVYLAWTGAAGSRILRFTASGATAPGWPAGGLSLTATDSAPALAGDGAGGVIVGWKCSGSCGVLRLDPSGQPAPGWNPDGVALSTLGGVGQLDLASDGAGGAVACFVSYASPDPARPYSLRAQRVTAGGALAAGWDPAGEIMRLSAVSPITPVIAGLGGGDAILMWFERHPAAARLHDDKVYAQRLGVFAPTPTLASLVRAEARAGSVWLEWFVPRPGAMATLYRRVDGEAWGALAALAADGAGHLVYEDRAVIPGAVYHYRLGIADGGVESYSGEVVVRVPVFPALALSPPEPNPSEGRFAVWASLPSEGTATLELLDVGGRRLHAEEVGGRGAGRYRIELPRGGRLASGVYVVRLRQGPETRSARVSVVP